MHLRSTLLAAVAAALLASPCGWAHVDYKDLSDPFQSPGGVNGGTFNSFGWYLGTTTTLGDSHELAGGELFRFSLLQDSLVTITFSDDGSIGALNPAFSLYRGLLPQESHDDTSVDPLNPKSGPPLFQKLASPVDDGVTPDGAGRISPFRDTANVEYVGQFDALQSWSMGNDGGEWSVLEYVAHVAPAGSGAVALTGFLLAAGDYTIAAGGGTACTPATCVEGLPGTLTFAAAPVPEPGTVWMMGGGLVMLAGMALRRQRSRAAAARRADPACRETVSTLDYMGRKER